MRIEIPTKLVQAARARRLLIFVGAGFSRQADPAKFPSWNQLLHRMISHFSRDQLLGVKEANSLRAVLDGNNPEAVAETLRGRVPRDAYYGFLQEQFASIPPEPSVAHRHLILLDPPMIITTNYDQLIENAYAHINRRALSVVDYSQPAQVRNKLLHAPRERMPFLFKLHGDIDKPSEVVLTVSDYEKLEGKNDGYKLLLSSLFFHYTTLFIGFSFSDREIKLHMRNVQEALRGERFPDYALISESDCDWNAAEEMRRSFGIHAIRYKGRRENHRAVPDFLQNLRLLTSRSK